MRPVEGVRGRLMAKRARYPTKPFREAPVKFKGFHRTARGRLEFKRMLSGGMGRWYGLRIVERGEAA